MLLIAVISLAVLILSHYFKHHRHDDPDTLSPQTCRLIIDGQQLSRARPPNLLTRQLSRALPNQRHRRVFGVENAFDTHDDRRAKDSVHHARRLLNLRAADWEALAGMAREAVRGSMENMAVSRHGTRSVSLVGLMQTLTLRVVLWVLFGMRDEAVAVCDAELVELAGAINDAWIASKRGLLQSPSSSSAPPRFQDNHRLQTCLARIFPAMNSLDPRDNPLNLILPGFETTWRVALRAVVKTGYTTASRHHPEWRALLVAFAHNPSKQQFERAHNHDHDHEHDQGGGGGGGGVSAKMLINEALRLYPPRRGGCTGRSRRRPRPR